MFIYFIIDYLFEWHSCQYIWMCIYPYALMCIYPYALMCIYPYALMCTHVCEESKGYLSKCACLHADGCIYNTICLCVCIYVYMFGSVYVNTCNILMMIVC